MKKIMMKVTMPTAVFMAFFIGLLNSVIAQTNPAQSGQVETLISNFEANGAMYVDRDDNVYVSEYGVFTQTGGSGKRLYKMTPNGVLLDSITDLSGPMGIVKDSKGNLYINNDNNTKRSHILKIDPQGNRTTFATVKGWPVGMNIDKNDNLYLTNYNSPEIYKIDSNGAISVFSKSDAFIGTAGIDFDSKGNLIVANFATSTFFSINPKGKITEIAQIKDATVQGWGIGHLTVVDDYIYATGIAVSKIFKISLKGEVEWFAGDGKARVVDGELRQSSFSNPNGIASDKKNKILYISEYGRKGGIRKIKL